MSNYRRAKAAGATYFFTVVTAQRRPLLANSEAIAALRASVAAVRRNLPFSINAWAVLPDHMHAIWTLPSYDRNFSMRWGLIKTGVTRLLACGHVSAPRQDSGLWQPRFWEHLVRDEADLRAHTDYVHYNPVKHGLVARVADWPYSTFHYAVERGIYTADWGNTEPTATHVIGFRE
jgi:putative transposase